MKIAWKKHYEKHKERHQERARQYHLAHREEMNAKARIRTPRWIAKNPERAKANARRAYERNGNAMRTRAKIWYEAHREYVSARDKANRDQLRIKERNRRAAHPEKNREKIHRRRARLLAVKCTLTNAEWQETLEIFDHRCAYCNRKGLKLEQEHIIAVSRGGPHTNENVIPACNSCNSRKRNKPVFAMASYI
jgi:5-methylcytosine-specific restriction endonuclease McrA